MAKLRVGSGEVNGELSRREGQITGSSLDRHEPFLSRRRFDGNDLAVRDFLHARFPCDAVAGYEQGSDQRGNEG